MRFVWRATLRLLSSDSYVVTIGGKEVETTGSWRRPHQLKFRFGENGEHEAEAYFRDKGWGWPVKPKQLSLYVDGQKVDGGN